MRFAARALGLTSRSRRGAGRRGNADGVARRKIRTSEGQEASGVHAQEGQESEGEEEMNVKFVISFRGVPAKFREALEKMVADDVAAYPERMRMESATFEIIKVIKEPAKRVVRSAKKSGTVKRATVKKAVKTVKRTERHG